MQIQGHGPITPSLPSARGITTLLVTGAGLAATALLLHTFVGRGSILPLMAVCGLALGILVVVYPTFGLYATVLAAGFVRVAVSTGTGTPIVASLGCAGILVAGWLIHQILNRRKVLQVPPLIALPALGLMATMTFALLWGRVTLDPRVFYYSAFLRVQLAALGLIVISIGLLFVGGDLMSNQRTRHVVMGVMLAVGLLYLPLRLVIHHVPVLSTGGLFGMWFFAIAWAQALVNTRLPFWMRVFLGVAAIGYLLNQFVLLRSWVSGWLPLGVALIVITTMIRPRLGFLTLALAIAYLFLFSTQASQIWTSEEAQGSAAGTFGRTELWRRNVDTLGSDVILGTGPVTYALYYMTFEPTEAMSSHNNYIDILAEAGIAGLISLFGILGGLWIVGRRVLRTVTDPADRAFAIAALGGVVGAGAAMMFGDWVIPFVYNQTLAGFDNSAYTWLMFAGLCGLAVQQVRARSARA